jgi:SAM-dependent methyltransferase
VHDELVARLEPGPGVRWLDLATGTGEVARRAAARGAEVTAQDISPVLLEQARAKVPQATFDVGDVQQLPYEDGVFDVVSSVFGVIFAPDHEAVARELARVCRDRLGLAVWEESPELTDVYRRFDLEQPEGSAFEWGRPPYVRELLGSAFDLSADRRALILEGASGEEVYELWASAAPPFKAQVESLEPERRAEFRQAYIEYCEQFRVGDRVRVPRMYLLVFGRKQ